ncbi:hypothetical protein ACYULU_10600 [Breznakiellaceae bacterium SP9]
MTLEEAKALDKLLTETDPEFADIPAYSQNSVICWTPLIRRYNESLAKFLEY